MNCTRLVGLSTIERRKNQDLNSIRWRLGLINLEFWSQRKSLESETVRVIFCAGQVAETVVILQRVLGRLWSQENITRREATHLPPHCLLMSQKHTARSQVAIAKTRKQSPYLAPSLAASLSSSGITIRKTREHCHSPPSRNQLHQKQPILID